MTVSKFDFPTWREGEYEEYDLKLFSPGIGYYADEIKTGRPFTLVRWGEGEWRHAVPAIPKKPFYNREVFRQTWTLEDKPSDDIARAIENHHSHDRYWCAIWHLQWLSRRNWIRPMQAWLRQRGLDKVRWHDGWVWRRAIQQGAFYPIIAAIREQGLPVCVVGPPSLSRLTDFDIDVEYWVEIDPWRAYYQLDMIQESVVNFGQPGLWIMCGGGPAKIAINRLFPLVGDSSFLIDFGATWEGLLGHLPRTYFEHIPPEVLEANWHEPA